MFLVKGKRMSIFLLFILFFLVSCSSAKDDRDREVVHAEETKEDLDPITLKFMMWDNWGQDFDKYIKEAVEDEFPHITLEHIDGDTINVDWLEDALAKGKVPDIIFSQRQYHVNSLRDYELGFDMTELIEKHEVDLSRYDPEHLEEWKSWTKGEVWMLPFLRDIYALHYNKEIFDLFGVEYPTDDMTWDEVIELAEKVTGVRDGVQYYGLDIREDNHLALTQIIGDQQLIDPETDEVLWTDNPAVKQWLEGVEQVYDMPDDKVDRYSEESWVEDRVLAMRPLWLDMETPDDVEMDIVTFPQWEEKPGIGPMAGGWALGVTEPSEHKDEAMKVLKFLYEDERIGTLGESPIHAPFDHLYEDVNLDDLLNSEELEKFKGKNLEALYQLTPSGGPSLRSEHDVGTFYRLGALGWDFIESGLDVNSFLRKVKEEEEIRIQDEKGTK